MPRSRRSSTGSRSILVFTGGVGENSQAIRERALVGLEFLGLSVDPGRNAGTDVDRPIGLAGAAAAAHVIAAREDLQIGREVRPVLAA